MKYLRAFPFLAVVVIAYNLVFVWRAAAPDRILLQVLSGITLPSGSVWNITTADVFIIAGLAFLFVEILSAGARTTSLINHGLSLLLFLVCFLEFLLVRACGNDTFFAITLMTLVDVVAGYTVSIRSARRDFAIEKE
jgi:hypothetical protein